MRRRLNESGYSKLSRSILNFLDSTMQDFREIVWDEVDEQKFDYTHETAQTIQDWYVEAMTNDFINYASSMNYKEFINAIKSIPSDVLYRNYKGFTDSDDVDGQIIKGMLSVSLLDIACQVFQNEFQDIADELKY